MVKPKRFVNYKKLTLFMSHLAHEFKRMGTEEFIKKYKNFKCHGVYKKYLDGYIEYHTNKSKGITIECTEHPKTVVVDPVVHVLYFKNKDYNIINELLPNAVPELLKRGILLTEVQEA